MALLVVLRKIREIKDLESRKPLHERVKIELARLKDQGYLEEKDFKSYYSGFSDVLRRYLERRFEIDALEKTTVEVVENLEKGPIEKDVLRAIREVLSQSDLVKFAKLVPSYDLAGELETLLLDAVERTKS